MHEMTLSFLFKNHVFSGFVQKVLEISKDQKLKLELQANNKFEEYVVEESYKLQDRMFKYHFESNIAISEAKSLVEIEYLLLNTGLTKIDT